MSDREVKDRDLEDVSGGAVDLQHECGIDSKTKGTQTSDGSGSGGPGDPGIDDMNQGD